MSSRTFANSPERSFMNLSYRSFWLLLILLPVTLVACASPSKNLERTSLSRPPEPTVRLSGTSGKSRGKSKATPSIDGPNSAVAEKSTTDARMAKKIKPAASSHEVESSPPASKKFRLVKHDSARREPAVLPEFALEPPVAERKRSTKVAEDSDLTDVPPGPSTGEDKVASKSDLTLSELEAIAEESNPALIQLAAVVEKARGIHEQVGLYPNPVVGYSGTEIGNDGAAGQQGGFISQTIVTGDKLRLNRDVASWNVQEMSWKYQTRRHRVLNDVRLRFYDVLGAQQRLAIADDLLKVAENGVKIAEQLRKAKQASRADVLQATVDVNQIQIIQQNAKYENEAAWKRLVAVLGRPDMQSVKLTGSLKAPVAQWRWDSTYQNLLDESPQLQALYARVQGARMAIQRQEVQPIPNILTQLGVARDYSSGDVITNVQIGIPLPIYNRNQGNIRVARSELQRAIRDAERLELQLRDRLAVAFRDFQQAGFQVEQYEKNILKNAEESRKLTEESYQAGQVNFLRVLTARRTYFEANLRYVDAQIALRKASVVIKGFVLTGGLTDVPDIASRAQTGLGQRGQSLSGQ